MFVALVAQRIEQKTSNLLVAGSIPAEGARDGGVIRKKNRDTPLFFWFLE